MLGGEKVDYFGMIFVSGGEIFDSVNGIYAGGIFDVFNNIFVMA